MGIGDVKKLVTAPTRAMSQQISRGGQPLPEPLRHQFETRMGRDLAGVRVHEGQEAVHVGARAFTRGQDIFVRAGHYDPHTYGGQELLAHEVVHTVQQGATRVHVPEGMVEVSEPSPSSGEPGAE